MVKGEILVLILVHHLASSQFDKYVFMHTVCVPVCVFQHCSLKRHNDDNSCTSPFGIYSTVSHIFHPQTVLFF